QVLSCRRKSSDRRQRKAPSRSLRPRSIAPGSQPRPNTAERRGPIAERTAGGRSGLSAPREFSSHAARRDQSPGAGPLFERFTLGQRAQLAPPDLPHEDNRRIRAAQTLRCSVGNRALPFLSDVILNV